MNMKKTTLATSILLSLMLAGCGDSSSSGGTTATETDPVTDSTADPVTDTTDSLFAAATAITPATAGFYGVSMLDTSTLDAPKFSYALDPAQAAGSASINIMYPTGNLTTPTFIFALRSADGVDDNAVIQLEAKLSGNIVNIKNRGGSTIASFTPDVWTNLSIAWTDGAYALYIDGVLATSADGLALNKPAEEAIEVYFKTSNNTNVTENALLLDDLVIYSDIEQTDEILNEDFDDTPVGTALSGYDNFGSYNDDLTLAVVAAVPQEIETTVPDNGATDDDTTPNDDIITDDGTTNLVAQVLDTDTGDTGELRIRLADSAGVSEIETGTMSFTFVTQADADTAVTAANPSNNVNISLYASGTSTNQLHAEYIFTNSSVRYRGVETNDAGEFIGEVNDVDVVVNDRVDANNEQVTIDGLSYSEGTAIDVVITWDALGSKISIDGGASFTENFEGQDFSNVTVVAFRLAGNSAVSVNELLVDDIVIEDDGVSVFDQDFEDFTVETELGAEFNGASSEATVQAVNF